MVSPTRRKDATVRLSTTVPRPLDSFIGREDELQAVQTLLATHRLVTLTGAAGIGKTRLALQVAEELAASYADGVCFVALVELTDPALVPQAVASALGLRERPDPRGPAPAAVRFAAKARLPRLLQTLADALASRAVLPGTRLRVDGTTAITWRKGVGLWRGCCSVPVRR